MFLTEYNEEKVKEQEREEGRKEGRAEGREEGLREGAKLKETEVNERVATDLLKEGGQTISFISKISKLSEDSVRKLAQSLGIAVAL